MEENRQVDYNAVTNHRSNPGSQNSRRKEMQRILFVANDHGVAGVIAAVKLHDVVNATAEKIGGFALALIAPLGANQHDCRHRVSLMWS